MNYFSLLIGTLIVLMVVFAPVSCALAALKVR